MAVDKSGMMYVAALTRWLVLGDERSKLLIKDKEESATRIQTYIDNKSGNQSKSNVKTRDYFFTQQIKKHLDQFERLLILSVGLDTKADRVPELADKEVIGIDLNANMIKARYREVGLETKAKIIPFDLRKLEQQSFHDLWQEAGLSLDKKTLILWEAGTFYLYNEDVYRIFDFFCENLPVVGIMSDFLNADVFHDEEHEEKELIDSMLAFLASMMEPWLGFFTKSELIAYFQKQGFHNINIENHRDVEKLVLEQPVTVDGLWLLATAIRQ